MSNIFLISLPAYCNPYVAAYTDDDVGETQAVIMSVDFYPTDGDDLSNNHWMAGVLSTAGGDGTTPIGSIWQIAAKLNDDDDVVWRSEYHIGEGGQELMDDNYIGEDTYTFFFVRMTIDGAEDLVLLEVYAYVNDWAVEHDVYTREYQWIDISEVDDDNFLFGSEDWEYPAPWGTLNNQYLQAGVESNAQISETSWRLQNGHVSYYDSGWKYSPGTATQGSDNVITPYDNKPWCVGCNDADADKYSAGSGSVTWKRDSSSPITSGTELWSTSGTMLPTVEAPFWT